MLLIAQFPSFYRLYIVVPEKKNLINYSGKKQNERVRLAQLFPCAHAVIPLLSLQKKNVCQ